MIEFWTLKKTINKVKNTPEIQWIFLFQDGQDLYSCTKHLKISKIMSVSDRNKLKNRLSKNSCLGYKSMSGFVLFVYSTLVKQADLEIVMMYALDYEPNFELKDIA